MKPLATEIAQQLSASVLFRIVRGDEKGRPFGTPRNPREPTLDEFNPHILEVQATELATLIVARKHGLAPEQTDLVGRMSNDNLTRFRIEDPISAAKVDSGLSLTGGHQRTHEIGERIRLGQLPPDTIVEVLIHD